MFGVSVPGAGATRGPVWNNAAPQMNIYGGGYKGYSQPQQAAPQPPAGASKGVASSTTPTPWNAYNYGRGGQSGNGMISSKDYAGTMAQLYQGQLDEFDRGWRDGSRQDINSRNAIEAQLKRFQNEYATGQSTMFYARPEFEVPWAEFNETARLTTSKSQDLESMLPRALQGQNTGERWKGFEATPIGTSFGGGDGGGDAWGTVAFAPEQARMTPATDYTRNRTYNNGNLSSASDYGSYGSPLLAGGGFTSPGPDRGLPYEPDTGGLQALPNPSIIDPRYESLRGWANDGVSEWRQRGVDPAQDARDDEAHRVRQLEQMQEDMLRASGAITAGGTVLPLMLSPTPDVYSYPGVTNTSRMGDASGISQGRLDAHYGYNGQLTPRERAEILNARPTYFDR